MVTVYADPGNEKNVAKALIAAAGTACAVRTTSQPRGDGIKTGIGFVVSEEVFEKFKKGFEKSDPVKVEHEEDIVEHAAPKRRGRPRSKPEEKP